MEEIVITAEEKTIAVYEFYCPICKKWKPMSINPVVILGRLTCPVHKWSELQTDDNEL